MGKRRICLFAFYIPHDVRPNVVAIAVSMEISILMIIFQVSFLFTLIVFVVLFVFPSPASP